MSGVDLRGAKGEDFRPQDLAGLLGLPLSDEQMAAITAPLESYSVVAAAGSGKTTVMAARVVWLVATGQIEPGQVIGLTFTRKAAAQLGRRVAAALALLGLPEGVGGEPTIATYDAFAAALVADHGAWLGQDGPARLLDEAGRYRLATEVVENAAGPLPYLSQYAPATLARWLLDLDQGLQANLVTAADLESDSADLLQQLAAVPPNRLGKVYREVRRALETVAARRELIGLSQAYAARKRDFGVVEFADQMATAVRLVQVRPAVRRDFAERRVVVLLDEYQDTSGAQAALLRQLFAPRSRDAWGGDADDPGRPVMAVGDPRQAIYGWRGASASNLSDFAPDFATPAGLARRFVLTVNRRCDRAVVRAANAIAPQPPPDGSALAVAGDAVGAVLGGGPGVAGDAAGAIAAGPSPHGSALVVAGDAARVVLGGGPGPAGGSARSVSGDVAAMVGETDESVSGGEGANPADPAMRAAPGAGAGWVETAGFVTWDEEVVWIADQVVRAMAAREVSGWGEIALLTRRNAELGPLWQALTDRDVPVEIVGLGGLLQVPEVSDLVARLRLAHDPSDNPSLIQVGLGPGWGLTRQELEVLGRRAGELAQSALLLDQPSAGSDESGHGRGQPPVEAAESVLNRRGSPGGLAGSAGSDGSGHGLDRPPAGSDSATDQGEPGDGEWVQRPVLAAALADPGVDCPPNLARRLRRLATALADWRALRRLPVVEAVDRLIADCGLEAELASWPDPAGAVRRRQLAAFREAVAHYAAGRRETGLGGLLAWLEAEAEVGLGLDRATASSQDSVKLLTVHRAKGLEWELVFLPGLTDQLFPLARGGANPMTQPAALPHRLRADAAVLPRLDQATGPGIQDFTQALRQDWRRGEDRLAYVAVTRARRRLVASCHLWRTGTRPQAASDYFLALEAVAQTDGRAGPRPAATTANPTAATDSGLDWPSPGQRRRQAQTARLAARVEAWRQPDAPGRRQAQAALAQAPAEVRRQVAELDAAADRLLAQAAPAVVEVALPAALTTSQVLWAARQPDQLAAALVRPWPRRPSPAARLGHDFHRWLQRLALEPSLLDSLEDDWEGAGPPPDDWTLPVGDGSSAAPVGDGSYPVVDGSSADLAGDSSAGSANGAAARLERLRAGFQHGRFAAWTPVAVERPFVLALGGRQIRGRIDAVYDRASAPGVVPATAAYLVVDWKTGHSRPDPLQLSFYRLAWAELSGVALDTVAAAFYHVGPDRLDYLTTPLDRAALTTLVAGLGRSA